MDRFDKLKITLKTLYIVNNKYTHFLFTYKYNEYIFKDNEYIYMYFQIFKRPQYKIDSGINFVFYKTECTTAA